MAGCTITAENRTTGTARSYRFASRDAAMMWIAGRLQANADSPETYWLNEEPSKIYESMADFPPQKGRYDDWE